MPTVQAVASAPRGISHQQAGAPPVRAAAQALAAANLGRAAGSPARSSHRPRRPRARRVPRGQVLRGPAGAAVRAASAAPGHRAGGHRNRRRLVGRCRSRHMGPVVAPARRAVHRPARDLVRRRIDALGPVGLTCGPPGTRQFRMWAIRSRAAPAGGLAAPAQMTRRARRKSSSGVGTSTVLAWPSGRPGPGQGTVLSLALPRT